MEQQSPLIITLRIDPKSQAFFDDLRQKHFPPAINYLKAHLTLFHHLPENEPVVEEALIKAAGRLPFKMDVIGVRHTGFGTAFVINSQDLQDLHSELRIACTNWLIPQDKQPFRPHITVQNKVTPAVSKQLVAELQDNFVSFSIGGIGLDSWWYRGGPWEHHQHYSFAIS